MAWLPTGTLVTGLGSTGGLNSSPGEPGNHNCNEPTPLLFSETACAKYVPTSGPAVKVKSVPFSIGIKCEKSPVKTFGTTGIVPPPVTRSEEHTSELQSRGHLVC